MASTSNLFRLGGGWQGARGGKSLYTGSVDRAQIELALSVIAGDQLRLVVLPNDRRTSDRSPDVAFFLAPQTTWEGGTSAERAASPAAPSADPPAAPQQRVPVAPVAVRRTQYRDEFQR